MSLFFGAAVVVVVLAHVYLAKRLFGKPSPTPRLRPIGRTLLALSAVASLAAFFGGRFLPRGPLASVLMSTGFFALGVMSVLFPLTLARDVLLGLGALVRAVRRTATRRRPDDPTPRPDETSDAVSRRAMLLRTSSAIVLGAGATTTLAGVVQASRRPRVDTVEVPIEGLHADLEGLTIVQITDLHVGPMLGRAFTETVVEEANALGADIVAVTGDLADGRVREIADLVAPLADLRAPLGRFFVTGNHEYYWDEDAWIGEVRRLGFDVLIDEHRVIARGGAKIVLAGVPDISAHRFRPDHHSDPALALAGAPPSDLRLLLAHQPRSLYAAVDAGYDLQLSGHTHGGQYFPWTLVIHLVQPVVAGLARFGKTWVYVSRGTGYWGPPLRTNGPGEIALVRLVRAAGTRA